MRVIARFPERVARAVDLDEPSEVATHLLDLCEAFHAYHTKGGRDPAPPPGLSPRPRVSTR